MMILACQGSYSRAHTCCHVVVGARTMSATRDSTLVDAPPGRNRRSQSRCNAYLPAGRLSAKRLALPPPGSQSRQLRCGPISGYPQQSHKRPRTPLAPISLHRSCATPALWNRCVDERPYCPVPVQWQLPFCPPREGPPRINNIRSWIPHRPHLRAPDTPIARRRGLLSQATLLGSLKKRPISSG